MIWSTVWSRGADVVDSEAGASPMGATLASMSSGLSRDIDLLRGLASNEARVTGGLGVVRLSQLVGRDKSQVSRALRALETSGLVERDPVSREYRLGWELFFLAARAGDQRLLHLSTRFLHRTADEIGEPAHLCVLAGTGVLTITSVAPATQVSRISVWGGDPVPAHRTSAGWAMLVDLGRDELERRFLGVAHERFGVNDELDDVEPLWRAVLACRQLGYASAAEEFQPGLAGVSAPVRDHTGRIVAAVNVTAPSEAISSRLPEVGAAVERAADDLSESLGFAVAPLRRATGPA
jgi:DNA-binding IclR family transcriptional regulator